MMCGIAIQSLARAACCAAVLAATIVRAQTPIPRLLPTDAIPPATSDSWVTGSAEQAGFDRAKLDAMTEYIQSHAEMNVHAVLIERDGRLVYEQYFSGSDERWGQPLGVLHFSRDVKHDLRSVTKSVVSALVGIAVQSGAIRSLDAPLVDYFPEYQDLQTPDRRKITLRHALSMSAGFKWNEEVPYTDPTNDEIVMTRSSDPVRYVLSRPIVAEPGQVWEYNGGLPQVLGTIVQRATKQPLLEYARSVLFSRLGITDIEWLGNLAGVPSGASGLRLRPRDLAKFGSLYLHDGQWNGRDVVPAAWVRESTTRHMTLSQPARGYAYLWWHACYPTPAGAVEVPMAVGNGFQRIFLVRAQKMAVTVLAGLYNIQSMNPADRLLLNYILPALPTASPAACPS